MNLLEYLLDIKCLGCKQESKNLICQSCEAQRQFLNFINYLPDFNQVFVRYRFSGLTRKIILEAKFHSNRSALKVLADWICAPNLEIPPETIIVPMPISFWRLAQRGYNQTEFLAQALGKKYNLPVKKHLLARQYRPPQALISQFKKRFSNLENSFILKDLAPKSVLLVDDVMTTGATFTHAGKLLRQHGTQWLGAICVAQSELG